MGTLVYDADGNGVGMGANSSVGSRSYAKLYGFCGRIVEKL